MSSSKGAAEKHTEELSEEERAYFASQSRVTDPGEHESRLSGLPQSIEELYRAANGLVIHFRLEDLGAAGIVADRLAEVDTRYAEAMLARLFELDERAVTERRAPRDRLVGCCRDFTVLFLAMARSVGLPARARLGFATYFFSGVQNDHEIAEVWDADSRRWRLVDPQLGEDHHDPNDGSHIDPTDVPRNRFLVAASAWHACKAGSLEPNTFMVHPDIPLPALRGWSYLAHNLVCDLATLNKMEMLLWDVWGLAATALGGEITPDEGRLLDRIAGITATSSSSLEDIRRLYDSDPRLRVPELVTSISPAATSPRSVRI